MEILVLLAILGAIGWWIRSGVLPKVECVRCRHKNDSSRERCESCIGDLIDAPIGRRRQRVKATGFGAFLLGLIQFRAIFAVGALVVLSSTGGLPDKTNPLLETQELVVVNIGSALFGGLCARFGSKGDRTWIRLLLWFSAGFNLIGIALRNTEQQLLIAGVSFIAFFILWVSTMNVGRIRETEDPDAERQPRKVRPKPVTHEVHDLRAPAPGTATEAVLPPNTSSEKESERSESPDILPTGGWRYVEETHANGSAVDVSWSGEISQMRFVRGEGAKKSVWEFRRSSDANWSRRMTSRSWTEAGNDGTPEWEPLPESMGSSLEFAYQRALKH